MDLAKSGSTRFQLRIVIVNFVFDFGRSFSCFHGGSFRFCHIPLREFNERREPAARSRKGVKNARNVLRTELKLPCGKRHTEAVVNFSALALRQMIPKYKIMFA